MPFSKVSPNLTWEELRCSDTAEYPVRWRTTRAVVLAAEFEAVRELYGEALVVNSGYRTPTYNTRIGGAAKSQHVEGRALDLMPLWKDQHTSAAVKRLWAAAAERASHPSSKLRGLGFSQWGVHMDTRPSATLVTWDFRR